MKRLTCDDPQDNFLTMMNYVFSADGWAYIRHDGKEANVPLTDWAEDQCMKHGCDEFAGECAQDIDEMLCDCLMDGEGCPVALAYCFACQAANLRDRLKAIEDILGEEYDLDQFREAATKINEPKGDGWVSVDDRLPVGFDGMSICQNVIAYTVEGEVCTGWLNGETWHLLCGNDDRHTKHGFGYVTHWRPLPEPPKEESV